MKKYFACSDIHGFYDEWMASLKEAGFDENNEEHILIVCGDIFDRGRKPLQVYEFIRSLPKERRYLIRGNHETLLRELVERGYVESHDVHNGTDKTLYDIAGISDEWRRDYVIERGFKAGLPDYGTPEWDEWQQGLEDEHARVENLKYNNEKLKEILDWIGSDEWCNYLELGKYVFVHAFVPVDEHIDYEKSMWSGVMIKDAPDSYDPDWRYASDEKWEKAMWGCPWKKFKDGLFAPETKEGKILVCGHWHTSDFYNRLDYAHEMDKWLKNDENPIYESKMFPGLIGLDACTVLSGQVNVLVLNEDELR